MFAAMTGPLQGRRVLDLALGPAAYCGKLLGDLGADVIKVEAPGGEAYRRERPRRDGADGFGFLHHNTSKRCVALDLASAGERRQVRELAGEADIVIEAFAPGFIETIGLDYDALSAHNPRVVVTSISGFGQSGPHRDLRSCDLVASAMAGVMYVTGEAEDPPVTMRGSHALVMAATYAAASSLTALSYAARSGRGQAVDISVQEALASVAHVTGAAKWSEDGIVPRRMGSGLFASIPSGAYPCRDGLVYLMVNRPAHWQELARWIAEVTGETAVLDPIFEGPSANRFAQRDLVDHFVTQLSRRFTVAEIYREGQRRHLAFAPVQRMTDVVADEHLAERSYFVAMDGLRYPSPPYRFSRSVLMPRAVETVPDADPRWRGPRCAGPPVGATGAALADLRVVELTAGMAGPWIGRIMAYHGADVIKIESSRRLDVTRQYVAPSDPQAGVQSRLSPWLTDWNAGKRCVALDLTKREGVELAKRLVGRADVVVENYAHGVAGKLGLSYAELVEVKPDLIMLSSSGYGASGPCASYISWGPNIEALSGLSALTGFPGRECTMTQFAYPDSLSALHGLVAVLAALDHRRHSGEGQHISLSQLEASIAVVGELAMEAMASGAEPDKLGNASADAAPHGCYPCRGEDRWCVIAVFSDDEWAALCRLIGREEMIADERFATAAARVRSVPAVDDAVAQWTRRRDAYEVMRLVQEAGVAAGVVQTIADKCERDEHLRARGYFEIIRHEVKGEVVADGIPTGLRLTPGRTAFAGRAIGADNEAVFRELVGLSAEDYQRYATCGAIETTER